MQDANDHAAVAAPSRGDAAAKDSAGVGSGKAVGDGSSHDLPLCASKPQGAKGDDDSEDDDMPLAARIGGGDAKFRAVPSGPKISNHDSDSDDVPLGKRVMAKCVSSTKPVVRRQPPTAVRKLSKPPSVGNKRKVSHERAEARPQRAKIMRTSQPTDEKSENRKKWTTLEWQGVLFPPEYEPHGVKMLYDGEPVTLTPEAEEVATFFAVMLETEYVSKPTFIKNFWEGFKDVLGRGHVIQDFAKCDFRPIHEWHLAAKEKKKQMTKEVRKQTHRDA